MLILDTTLQPDTNPVKATFTQRVFFHLVCEPIMRICQMPCWSADKQAQISPFSFMWTCCTVLPLLWEPHWEQEKSTIQVKLLNTQKCFPSRFTASQKCYENAALSELDKCGLARKTHGWIRWHPGFLYVYKLFTTSAVTHWTLCYSSTQRWAAKLSQGTSFHQLAFSGYLFTVNCRYWGYRAE